MKTLVTALALGLAALGTGFTPLGAADAGGQVWHTGHFDLNSPSPAAIRAKCHTIISSRDADPHDAFVRLMWNGDKTSVPLLIRALSWQPKPKELPGGIVVDCTILHCTDALKALTGEDFGDSADPWQKWWDETGAKLPLEHFKPRKSQPSAGAAGMSPAQP